MGNDYFKFMKGKYHFGYGRKQTIDKMKDIVIELPRMCAKIAFRQMRAKSPAKRGAQMAIMNFKTHSSQTDGILDFIFSGNLYEIYELQ